MREGDEREIDVPPVHQTPEIPAKGFYNSQSYK